MNRSHRHRTLCRIRSLAAAPHACVEKEQIRRHITLCRIRSLTTAPHACRVWKPPTSPRYRSHHSTPAPPQHTRPQSLLHSKCDPRPTTEPDGNLRGFNSVEILKLLYTCPHTSMYGSLLDPRAARSALLCCNPPIRPQRRSSHQHAADVLVRLSGLFQRLVGLLARGP
jgi:hypothetical protein